MKITRFFFVVATLLLITTNVIVGLLTNYASATIPQILQDNTRLIWALIGLGVLVSLVLSLLQANLDTKNTETTASKQKRQRSVIPSDIPDSQNTSRTKEKDMQNYAYDVFVSYSHKDSDWVENILLKRLEEHHFRVFIDFRDFVTGKPGIMEMERGVIESKYVLVVLSKNYLESEWATFENIMAQTLDPAAINRKVIPVLLDNCQIPLRIRILHYRDLRNNNEMQWDLLIRDLA